MGNKIISDIRPDNPKFIYPLSGDIFYIATNVQQDEADGRYMFGMSAEESVLHIGRDLREHSTRGLSLLVKQNRKTPWPIPVLGDLRRFAEVAGFDYFSFEAHGRVELIKETEEHYFWEIKPRVFFKILDN